MEKNIFVFGLNRFNTDRLKSLRRWEQCNFYNLLDINEIKDAEQYDFTRLLNEADRTLASFPGRIDAIVNFWDFPASVIHPILCSKYGLRGPSLESVLKCGHKYWGRLEQRRAVPECVPAFHVFDPFDDNAMESIALEYPFWIKPVLSYSAYLGFRVNGPEDFRTVIPLIRENIGRYAEPFAELLQHHDLPPEVAHVDASHCLAEALIGGKQCTVEGFVMDGKVETFGLIDSYRFPNRVSFQRYEYPSALPGDVKARIDELSCEVIRHIGYDNAAFNIEYFYDRSKDRLWLLEINSRISQSHSDLFEKVDGRSNHEVVVETALGNHPSLPEGKGEFRVAAKMFVRRFEDGMVVRVPGEDAIERIKAEMPGTVVVIPVQEGGLLSEVLDQDSYSYQLAVLYIGAQSRRQLRQRYKRAVELLHFEIAPIQAGVA